MSVSLRDQGVLQLSVYTTYTGVLNPPGRVRFFVKVTCACHVVCDRVTEGDIRLTSRHSVGDRASPVE